MPKLLVSLPDGEVSHELQDPQITVGRISDNTVQIEDPSVSSHHAQLVAGEGGDYILEDIGSTNGTWINSKPAAEGEKHQLQDGDKIRFGKVDVTYASENPANARPMPESERTAAELASSSVRPSDFSNASPFQTKLKKKDKTGLAVLGLGVLSLLAFVVAVVKILGMQSPFGA